MSYEVEIKKSALKSFTKLPKSTKTVVSKKLIQLRKFPKVSNVKKLTRPLDGYRLRVGKFRILFTVDPEQKQIIVYIIDHGKSIYNH